MKKISLEIDGKKVEVEPGTTILEAAQQVGIEIPTLCHDEKLKPYGCCRFCSVEITKGEQTEVVASCCYPAEEGLTVKTNSERINKIRKTILELLLPLAPNCKCRSLVEEYGARGDRFPLNQEPTDCICCGKCVRYCREVKKANVIGFIGRGVDREVALVPGKEDYCLFCRECFDLCDGGKIVKLVEKRA